MSTKDVIKKSILEGFSMEMSTFHVVSILLITVLLSVYIFYIYRSLRFLCMIFTFPSKSDKLIVIDNICLHN